MPNIVGLFTELIPNGGIQRASRHVAAVTSDFAAEHGISCRFLSLNDPRGLHRLHVGLSEFSVSGYARSRTQFVLAALRAAARGPSLVIALHPHLAPVVWAMRLRSREFQSIIFAHGVEIWQPLAWPRGPALRRANLVVGPSADTVQHLVVEQGVSPGRARQLAWGLDPDFEAMLVEPTRGSRPRDFPEHGRIILTVGRWDPAERYKGADTLIAALPRVLQALPDTFLVLVGDGGDRPRLEQLARDQGVVEHTRFLHGLTQDELFACYEGCDVFALPSRGEGFGFVFLEAMAHGKPVVAGAHGGALDVIEDGVTGRLVPHGDTEQLSRALELILTDPAEAKEMGARGRDRVDRFFSFNQFRSLLAEVLEDVLVGKQSRIVS